MFVDLQKCSEKPQKMAVNPIFIEKLKRTSLTIVERQDLKMRTPNIKDKQYEVFISYGHKDGVEYANHLKSVLEKIGYSTFVAEKDMDNYNGKNEVSAKSRILRFVDKSRYFILILTKSALQSNFVQMEIAHAKEKPRSIFSYYHKPSLSSKDIKEPYLINKNHIPQFESNEELAQKVITNILGIEHEFLASCGIVQIFENRRSPDYAEAIRNCIEPLRGVAVKMLGISFKDWFGENDSEHQFAKLCIDAVDRNVRFEVLLLDPTSEVAKERAEVEVGQILKDDCEFVRSDLFQDIKKVAFWIRNKRKSQNKNHKLKSVEARFYHFMLSIYAIITPKYIFMEQYHNGTLGAGSSTGSNNHTCAGGHVPVYKVDSTSTFGQLITDHFRNTWRNSEGRTENGLYEVLERIQLLEKDPINFRTQQFIIESKEKCIKLAEAISKTRSLVH